MSEEPPSDASDGDLLGHVLVPVAHPDDAEHTVRALARLSPRPRHVTALHVVEKGGGVPDKTPVEQSEQLAEESFEVVRETFPDAGGEVRYGRDVVASILEAADDLGATAIAFRPREGGTIERLLTGDLSIHLITEAELPVIALPRSNREEADGAADADDADGGA